MELLNRSVSPSLPSAWVAIASDRCMRNASGNCPGTRAARPADVPVEAVLLLPTHHRRTQGEIPLAVRWSTSSEVCAGWLVAGPDDGVKSSRILSLIGR